MLEWKRSRRHVGERLIGGRQFATYVTDIFVVTKRDKLRMPQVVAAGPFRVFDLCG